MSNKLIIVGYEKRYRYYLNVHVADAINRFLESDSKINKLTLTQFDQISIKTIDFDDEFLLDTNNINLT